MGFRFRRSVRILPGVRLNFSARGMSATVGPRGASVNFGGRGTYANLGLPGTGLSYRERLDRPESGHADAIFSPTPESAPPAALSASGAPGEIQRALGDEVARMIPLWPWVSLLGGGLVLALGAAGGPVLLVGLLAAGIGALGAAGVPAHRAELRAHLQAHEGAE